MEGALPGAIEGPLREVERSGLDWGLQNLGLGAHLVEADALLTLLSVHPDVLCLLGQCNNLEDTSLQKRNRMRLDRLRFSNDIANGSMSIKPRYQTRYPDSYNPE